MKNKVEIIPGPTAIQFYESHIFEAIALKNIKWKIDKKHPKAEKEYEEYKTLFLNYYKTRKIPDHLKPILKELVE